MGGTLASRTVPSDSVGAFTFIPSGVNRAPAGLWKVREPRNRGARLSVTQPLASHSEDV